MRHLGSLITSIVIGIVAWIAIGWSQAHLGTMAVTGTATRNWSGYWLSLLIMACAGLVIGIIAATRISPTGPFVVGLGYLVLQALYVTWPGFLGWLPNSVFGQTDVWTRPERSGMTAVLGLVLLASVLSIRRWQRQPRLLSAGRHTEQPPAAPAVEATTASQFPMSDRRDAATTDTAERPTFGAPPERPATGESTTLPGTRD
jgi:hypothetical protein